MGIAIIAKDIYSGIRRRESAAIAPNGLLWGLDNWIHGANGNSGGNVTSFKGGKAVKHQRPAIFASGRMRA